MTFLHTHAHARIQRTQSKCVAKRPPHLIIFFFLLFTLAVACSTVTVTKCLAALKTLQAFPFFRPTCLCKEPGLDPECNNFRDFLFDHPCGVVSKRGTITISPESRECSNFCFVCLFVSHHFLFNRKRSISNRCVAHMQPCAIGVSTIAQMYRTIRKFQNTLQSAR